MDRTADVGQGRTEIDRAGAQAADRSGQAAGCLLVSRGLDGHRREYVDLFSRLLKADLGPAEVVAGWRSVLNRREPAFFLMIEEHPLGFVLACLWRSLTGRATCGLLFRAREAARPKSAALWLKHYLLRLVKALPRTKVLTILPFFVAPELARVASDWIYDPQLWDAEAGDELGTTDLSAQLVGAAKGRPIVAALGEQSPEKGFDWFVRLWLDHPELAQSFQFAAYGKVKPALKDLAEAFRAAGGVCVDRFIDDAELRSIYGTAGLIWAAYAPHYDQASGIFGRSIQYGLPVIVRAGSLTEQMATRLDHDHLGIGYFAADAPAKIRDFASRANAAAMDRSALDEMRTRSLAVVKAALQS